MITKQDRSELVEDFKKVFVTKDEFRKLELQMDKNTERIIDAMGDMLKPKADTEDLNEQQRQLDNHETRILALEVK